MTTEEYMFCEISLNVVQCKPLETITLSTCLRIPVKHIIKLENPIKTHVTFNISSNNQFLSFTTPLSVEPLTEVCISHKNISE